MGELNKMSLLRPVDCFELRHAVQVGEFTKVSHVGYGLISVSLSTTLSFWYEVSQLVGVSLTIPGTGTYQTFGMAKKTVLAIFQKYYKS